MRRLAPHVPASQLIESATKTARVRWDSTRIYGTLEPGKQARILGVRVPDAVSDVEEYLLSGIGSDQLLWVGDSPESVSQS
jgi:hypothetical protein